MRFLLDMNISPMWTDILGQSGFDAVHWFNIGDPRALDEVIFEYSRINGFIIITHDLDFSVILSKTKERKPSVVQLRTYDMFPGNISGHVISSIRKYEIFLIQGAILTIDLIKSRVRLLPL